MMGEYMACFGAVVAIIVFAAVVFFSVGGHKLNER